ncbi:phosphoribosylformylglycinamidine cyclo-ligase [Myxacorys almedinensis]|uniref:Phosphoribosylformylglycinamidine cyclo-ligase n=1 Tax=Myxacorys almedinensis A TaxID=2690445 RepID=A0A8J8CI25_9CYAN|nr:phosphoribosylformylglycinamidine cyclo-ligase [Myxacorys almedinensis]NDJ17313.1 phosphoribosylformylglycinamidine cyclo-ligase [Myxacorys almedinensis A]
MDYRDAGVDVEAGRAFVDRISTMVKRTYRPEVLGGIGGFSGLFQLPKGYQEPVLVSGTDGVGTKLTLAHRLKCHDTVGIDLVAMCANDVLTCGAEPLFFLDYVATGHLDPAQLAQVVEGIVQGCELAGCALLGGETAEMPGFYQADEYDLAGFAVGIVEKSQILDRSQVQIGDVAIALPSTGVHSNGFSLVRKIIRDRSYAWSDRPDVLGGKTLGEELLTPTQIYVKPVLAALKRGIPIHGMAHITGGGLPENLPRCLQPDQSVDIDLFGWEILPIFHWLAAEGNVQPQAMFHTFNMGVGFVVIVPSDHEESILRFFRDEQGIKASAIGKVVAGDGQLLGIPT